MITQVEIVDFLSHRDTTLKFDIGMNVIVGPNGAGKSSVVDAITFALFGEHTRGVKESLIRHNTTGGFSRVEFKVGQRHFDVIRKIKAGSSVTLREQKDGVWRDIAAGERKQMGESTKHEVEKILGMDFNMLQIASIIRQGELDKIVHEGPKDFKIRINSIIGLDILDKAHDKMGGLIGQFRDTIRKKLGYDDTHLLTLDANIKKASDDLLEAKIQTESLGKSKEQLASKVSELDKQYNAVKGMADAQEQWNKRLTELVQYVSVIRSNAILEIGKLDNIISECTVALENYNKGADVKDQIESLRQTQRTSESEISEYEKMLASLNEQLNMSEKLSLKNGKCPVCNSQVSELNPLFVGAHINEEIIKINDKLDAQRTSTVKAKQEIIQLSEIESSVTAATATLHAHSICDIKDVEQIKQKRDTLKDRCNAANSCINGDWNAAGMIDQQTQTHCDALAALEPMVGPKDAPRIEEVGDKLKNSRHMLDETIARHGAATHRVDSLEKELVKEHELKDELDTVKHYIKKLEAIQNVFYRDGVVATSFRSWALTTISDACTEHLSMLDTRINRITLSEKKRSVEIRCHAGSDSFGVNSLSGGEQICVALALRLGMIRLLGTNRPTFVILDEPTAHLDADRRKSMVHVLAGLASATEAGTMQFIVITHDMDIFDEAPVERRYELDAGTDGTRVQEI